LLSVFPRAFSYSSFLRWLQSPHRDDEFDARSFRDMALNHLPHLYHGLRQIAGHWASN